METRRAVVELWPVIGYAAMMIVFVLAMIAWDIRKNREEWERDGWPR